MINSLSNEEKLNQFVIWAKRGLNLPRCVRSSIMHSDYADEVMLLTDDEALQIDKRIKSLMGEFYQETKDWRTPEEWKKVRLQYASYTDRARQLRTNISVYKIKIEKFEEYLIQNL